MSSIYDTVQPDAAAVIYQKWVNGSLKRLTPADKQTIWVRIHNLEVKLKNTPEHLLEGMAQEINELRKIVSN